MGLLDRLFGAAKAIGGEAPGTDNEPSTRQLEEQVMRDGRPFDVKLREVIAAYPGAVIETGIPADALELRAGKEIYARGGNRCEPKDISYRILVNGKELFIRLWKDYAVYDHCANRQIKMYCDLNGILMLDFFDYLPNALTYMQERIASALA
ncbi:MAG: hypothetical protein K6E50_09475 [Lachnospiraceae bacterium]|nr:hypothetical protein [Lachnospiraceae bacterium]